MGKECTPKTFQKRIIFTGMMKELAFADKLHRSDGPKPQNAAIIRDSARRFRPGCWASVVPGSQKFDKKRERQSENDFFLAPQSAADR